MDFLGLRSRQTGLSLQTVHDGVIPNTYPFMVDATFIPRYTD
jgi:hypothetical protein